MVTTGLEDNGNKGLNSIEESCSDFARICHLPIYYGNVRSIPAKTDFRSRVAASLYKVLCFTETWLNQHDYDDAYFPYGYRVYRCDRQTNGGGVAVLVHDEFKSTHIKQISHPECESICVKIEMKPTPLVMYVAYVNQPKPDILSKHCSLVERLMSLECDSRIVVLGDFNLHDVKWNSDDTETYFLPQDIVKHSDSVYFRTAADFLQRIHQLPMYQISNIENVSLNVLDLVFVNQTTDIQLCKAPASITKVRETDRFHPPIEIAFEYESGQIATTNETVETFLYKRGNYERISEMLNEINFAELFDKMGVEESFDYFYDLMNGLIVENVPRIRVRKSNKPKWWTDELQKKKNKRDKLYKKKPKNELTPEYVAALTDFNELHEKLQTEYIDQVQQNIVQNPAEFWSYAKMKQKRTKYPIEMQLNGEKGVNPKEVVELFADYFESIYVKDEDATVFEDIYSTEPANSQDINLTLQDIENAITKLKVKGSAGPDNLGPIVIKQCSDALVWPLWILHQKSMELGKISSRLKISRVVPEFKKKGDKADIENYRITAISSVILRIYEIAVQVKLLDIINPQLSNAQHGFRPKRSISTNLLNLSIAAHEAFAKKQQLDVFYGDFQNAFDKATHSILTRKAWSFGIGKKTAKWIFEFLVGRKFFVQIGSTKSRIYESTSGVPAGSILGPLLFVMFINDIVDSVRDSMILLFADDVKMSMPISSIEDTRCLQADINKVLRWSELNKMPFNPQKCNIISIRRTREIHTVSYTLGQHQIERKNEIRDLGILVDCGMTFSPHIEQITTKARQSAGYIKWISKGQFGIRTLKVLFTSYVRSKLEFASVIWDPYSEVYRNDIESVQKQFVIYALGDTNRIPPYVLPPYEDRCAKLGLGTLAKRRMEANVMMAYDLYNGVYGDRNLERKLVRMNRTRILRDNRILQEYTYVKDYSYNQPLAKIIRLVNEYGEMMSMSRSRFKVEFNEMVRLREDEMISNGF